MNYGPETEQPHGQPGTISRARTLGHPGWATSFSQDIGTFSVSRIRDLNELRIDIRGQERCGGCRNMDAQLLYWLDAEELGQHDQDRFGSDSVFLFALHASYTELDECAKRCFTCRMFRQALILSLSTFKTISQLGSSTPEGGARQEICGVFYWGTGRETILLSLFGLEIQLKAIPPLLRAERPNPSPSERIRPTGSSAGRDVKTAGADQVEAARNNDPNTESRPKLVCLPTSTDIASTFTQVRRWLSDCEENHKKCKEMIWSSELPSRLLSIDSHSQMVRLVSSESVSGDLRYVALSYCWGQSRTANTLLENLEDRTKPFSAKELPHTIRDAITFTRNVGIKYIWVDAICIIQDSPDDWRMESQKMQLVYSNAYFTLCATAADDGDTGLFHPRETWRFSQEDAYLGDRQLVYCSPSLWQSLRKSRWSSRCWTFQEEILSPRAVYVSAHSMHWLCCEAAYKEQQTPIDDDNKNDNYSIQFILNLKRLLCTSEKDELFHQRWREVIRLYSSRYAGFQKDRLIALSGLAARYLVQSPHDTYMAGLWSSTLGQDLAWKAVEYPGSCAILTLSQRISRYPSWSWASAPMGFSSEYREDQASRKYALRLLNPTLHEPDTYLKDLAFRISNGAQVTSITVSGRTRALCSSASTAVPWWSVHAGQDIPGHNNKLPKRTQDDGDIKAGREAKYMFSVRASFNLYLSREVHSAEKSTSTLALYDPNTKTRLVNFDYKEHMEQAAADPSKITCLQVTDNAMLILQEMETSVAEQDVPVFQRIGISWEFGANFFDDATETVIQLV